MRLALTVFGHTLTIDTRIDCDHDDGDERDVDLNGTIVEHADPRAELDHRVRPDQTLGFR